MIIFQHIPKTGGTSLRGQLEQRYNEKLFYNEHDYPSSNVQEIVSYRRKKYADDFNKIMSLNYDIVFGHFTACKYGFIKDIISDVKMICFLRDPVDRTISHYYYWKSILCKNHIAQDSMIWTAYPEISELKEGRLSLIDFARMEWVKNFYEIFIGDFIDEYEFIGLTEKYENSLNAINQIVGANFLPIVENANIKKQYLGEIKKYRHEIQVLNRMNYKYYNRAINKFWK